MGWEGSPVCSVLPIVIQTHCTQEDPNSKHENICFILSANLLLILPPALSLSFNKTIKSDPQSVLLSGDIHVSKRQHSEHKARAYRKKKKQNRENTQKMLVRNT